MVSLIDRGAYLEQFGGNQKVHAFLDFIFPNNGDSENQDEPVIDVDATFMSLMGSITKNDKSAFDIEYNKISQRVPNAQTPFVNDDYLLFVIAIGIVKFNEPITWFESVLEVRKCVTSECLSITRTLQNLVGKNYNSLDNNFSIMIVLQHFLGISLVSKQNKKNCYSIILSKRFPKYDSEFLNIIDIKAFDTLIEEQILDENGDLFLLREKEAFITKRINQIANYTYIFLYVIWIGIVYYLYYKFPSFQNFIQSSESIFGFLGFSGILALFFKKEIIVKIIEKRISYFLLG